MSDHCSFHTREVLRQMKRAYCRCIRGHYFTGQVCSLDGWSAASAVELNAALRHFSSSDDELSIERLREAGVSEASLDRIVIVEFGPRATVFDLLSPEGYVIDGKWVDRVHFPIELL
jgi:hypothetical protein